MKEFLNYVVIPIIVVVVDVVGVSKLYPLCEGSVWKLFLLYFGVYITYEIYRVIKNYYLNY